MTSDVSKAPMAGNNATDAPSESIISVTFWIVFMIQVLLPLIVLFMGVLCRGSVKDIVNFRKRNVLYDTQLLRRPGARTSSGKVSNVLFYRHRPLPLELLRVCVEVAILLYILGYVRLVVLLSLWCIFDLAQGLHVLNLVYLKHTPAARSATSLATYIATMYSLLYGFPLGFISKLMWIVWLGSRIALHTIFVPFYIEAVAALVFAIFFLLPNMCWRAGVNRCQTIVTRFQVLLLLLCFFSMWLVTYFNVNVCDAPPVNDLYTGASFKHLYFYCSSFFRSWTTAFLPINALLVVSLFVILWATAYKGMVYRFLPEISFLWSSSLVFIASLFSKDMERLGGSNRDVLGGTIFILLVSILITVFINFILIFDIILSLKAEVSQHAGRSSLNESEVKRRAALRQNALKDYIHEGGKTMLRGTLLRHLKKRDRTKDCVVCLDSFKKTKEITENGEEVNEVEGTATDDLLGIIRKCGHYFHFNCVWDWIQRQNTCPLCRIEVQVNKDAIKTVHYDDVRYALDRNRDTMSTIGTVSQLVSKAENSKSRPPVSGTLFRNSSIIEDEIDRVEEVDGQDPNEPNHSQRGIAIPPGAYVVGDRGTSYKNHTRSSSKHCGVCKLKFITDRQQKDVVVGYLRQCGHFFHCECIDKFVKEQEKCPTCQSLESRRDRRPAEGSSRGNGADVERTGSADDERPGTGSGNSRREHAGNAPPERGSRKHRAESRHKHRASRHSSDLAPSRSARDSGSANHRAPDMAPSGASRPARPGYVRNPKHAGQSATSKRFVHTEDILFVFLSDVQNDIKRTRGRKSHGHSSVHVV